MPCISRLGILVGLIITLLCKSIAAAPLTIERDGNAVYLAHQGARLLIEDNHYWVRSRAQTAPVALDGGYAIQPQAWESIADPWNDVPRRVTILKDNHRLSVIDLQATLNTWVKDGVNWGTPERNSSIKHWARTENHGVVPVLSDITPAGTSALAVFNVVARGPSGRPIYAQLLVRLTIDPPVLTIITPLLGFAGASTAPMPRLFTVGRHILLYTNPSASFEAPSASPARFDVLGADGISARTAVTLPSKYSPQGMIDNRWVVMANIHTGADRVYCYDLTRYTMKRLRGPWDKPGASLVFTIPPQGAYIMIEIQGKTNPTYFVRLDDGQTRLLPNPTGSSWRFIWHGMAIIISGDRNARAYDVITGKLLTTLAL